MTEEEWLSTSEIYRLVQFLHERGDERRLRLFAHACCQRFLQFNNEELFLRALAAVERCAEGELTATELGAVESELRTRANEIEADLTNRDGVLEANQSSSMAYALAFAAAPSFTRREVSAGVVSTLGSLVLYVQSSMVSPVWERTRRREDVDRADKIESAFQVTLVRDIYGNPFRPPPFDSRWRTGDVIGLARGINEDRAYDRLPLLCDALMDAGCDAEDILAHCRSEGPHVRGCWLVDLVLAKE
jgi:hypothetical protein